MRVNGGVFYVSRSTVRQSVSQLVQEGILEIRKGKGTFVAVSQLMIG
ncbi:MAG TPA: GntR family transcriptional regulator [Pseudogracilibacillus sp.]|nr:GntR family transcriptional regulator [Pseudogracilibacillus sp.]